MDWERLGRMVIERRIQLGMPKQQQFEIAVGMTRRLLSDIENGRRDNYDVATLVRLEQALGWQPGSADAVLSGGLPALIPGTVGAEDAPEDDSALDLIRDTDLDDRIRGVLLDMGRAIMERHKAERDALRDRQLAELRVQLQSLIDTAREISTSGRVNDG
jgi:transcriptional regulator with XRE-family HTH domain